MHTVALEGDAVDVVSGLPRRFVLSHRAVADLFGRLQMPLPWQADPSAGLAELLGDGPAEPVDADPTASLVEAGLVEAGPVDGHGAVDAEAGRALAGFARPEAIVDLTLARTLPGGGVGQLSAWHRLAGSRVTTVSSSAAGCELAWFDARWWAPSLAALVAEPAGHVTASAGATTGPMPGLLVPLELLPALGEARRSGREDLVDELVARAPGPVSRDHPGHVLPEADARAQLRLVGGGVSGRLRAVVAGPATRTIGLVSWVLVADGWRELTPVRSGTVPLVRLDPVPPEALAARVARLVMEVRS